MSAERPVSPSDIASGLSVAVAAAVSASVVYNWGFLSALRLGFGAIPTSFTDHAGSALYWLPFAILGLSLSFVGELFVRRVERGRTREEQLEGLPERHWIRALWRSSDFIPLIYALIFAALFLVVGEIGAGLLSLTFSIFWVWFSGWVLSNERVSASLSTFARLYFLVTPIVAVYAYSIGWTGAVAVYHSPTMIVEISNRTNGALEDRPVVRLYEGGVLYRDHRTLTFRQWEHVHSLRAVRTPSVWYGLLPGRREPAFPNGPPPISQSSE